MSWTASDAGLYPVLWPTGLDAVVGLAGVSLHMVCPAGCFHTVAIEPTLTEAIEAAHERLAAHPAPGALLIATGWHPDRADEYAEARATFEREMRGTVH